jgi:predicted SAM-dependent methyltransferase
VRARTVDALKKVSGNQALRTVAKTVLTEANRPLATRRMRRLIAETEAPYRVELGAATVRHADLIPTDVGWRSLYWLDATAPWPFPDGSVSHVYGDNMIEHVTIDDARAVFRHAHRAMAPGGRLRLVTPDAERFARMYLENGNLLVAQTQRNLRHGYRVDHPVSLLRTIFAECGHHQGYIWDFASLAAELTDAGFVGVQRCDVQDSGDPVLAGLENRTESVDRLLYLVVEATRDQEPTCTP